jgi:hypothetical protein
LRFSSSAGSVFGFAICSAAEMIIIRQDIRFAPRAPVVEISTIISAVNSGIAPPIMKLYRPGKVPRCIVSSGDNVCRYETDMNTT